MFGKIRVDPEAPINENSNFQSFTGGVLVLFRITTLNAWYEIMVACADQTKKNCELNRTQNCGTWASYPFFFTFVLICSYLMTNLFLAVIMDNFSYLTRDSSILDSRHFVRFIEVWKKFDKDDSGTISATYLVDLLQQFDPPLGFGSKCPELKIKSKLLMIRTPISEDNKVYLKDLCLCLVLNTVDVRVSREVVRNEVAMIVPKSEEELLERIIPQDHLAERPEAERTFYEDCATAIIRGYLKIWTANMRRQKRAKPELSTNVSSITLNGDTLIYAD